MKWNPLADTAIDATINPDFSQIESDVAQIAANERFALFFPEKRPFFLEGVDLFSTPIQAVYTRTITSPRWGLRATGQHRQHAYTALVTQDRGGGLVDPPGPQGSDFAPQDFESDVGVARVRRDFGQSFVSFLATAREIDGGGHNRVFGPDFQWRPRPTGHGHRPVPVERHATPDRPDLATEWDGRKLVRPRRAACTGRTARGTSDCFVSCSDSATDFRADNGFIPQVGYREVYLEGGYTFRPKDAFLSRSGCSPSTGSIAAHDGDVLTGASRSAPAWTARWNSFLRVELNEDADPGVGDELLQRFTARVFTRRRIPARVVNQLRSPATSARRSTSPTPARGTARDLSLLGHAAAERPPRAAADREPPLARRRRSQRALGPAVHRPGRAPARDWSFNSRSFVRLIGQYVETDARPRALHLRGRAAKSAAFTGSALFAYKLNWQTVLYVGYGDKRAYSETTTDLEHANRQLFLKVSYAWQH